MNLSNKIHRDIRASMITPVEDAVWDYSVWSSVSNSVWVSVNRSVWVSVDAAVHGAVTSKLEQLTHEPKQ